MQLRRLGPFGVSCLGLGCMNLSHAYGTPPPAEAAGALLLRALDRGLLALDCVCVGARHDHELPVGTTIHRGLDAIDHFIG